MTASTTTDTATASIRRTHDARTYWRVALAVAAPLPWAAMGLVNLLQPFAGDEDFGSTVEKVRDNLDLVLATSWIVLPFFAFLIPSVLAVVAATRRRAPRLAAWGGTLTVVGFGLGFSGVGGEDAIGGDRHPGVRRQDHGPARRGVLDRAARTGRRPLLGHRVDHRTGPARPRPVAQPRRGRDLRSPCCSAGLLTRSFQEVTSRVGLGLLVAAVGYEGPPWPLPGPPNEVSHPPVAPPPRSGRDDGSLPFNAGARRGGGLKYKPGRG